MNFLEAKRKEILRSVCSLYYCLRRPHQHQCQHLYRRRSGSCRCCCTQPHETRATLSFHGAACSSSGNCHCDGGIGADIGAGVDVSHNSKESRHFARSPTAWFARMWTCCCPQILSAVPLCLSKSNSDNVGGILESDGWTVLGDGSCCSTSRRRKHTIHTQQGNDALQELKF